VYTEGGEGLEVGLNTGAPAAIRAGDGQGTGDGFGTAQKRQCSEEIRNPKPETRRTLDAKERKAHKGSERVGFSEPLRFIVAINLGQGLSRILQTWILGVRPSDFFRSSGFGLRIASHLAPTLPTCASWPVAPAAVSPAAAC
jgi:hypothetical protein